MSEETSGKRWSWRRPEKKAEIWKAESRHERHVPALSLQSLAFGLPVAMKGFIKITFLVFYLTSLGDHVGSKWISFSHYVLAFLMSRHQNPQVSRLWECWFKY